MQAKTSSGFKEPSINQLISITRHLLQLSTDENDYPQYHSALKTAFSNFRKVYRRFAAKFPQLVIRYYYASKRSDGTVHPNTRIKADELVQVAVELYPEADVSFEFLGARRLLELARKRPRVSFDLRVDKSLSAESGYVVLSNLEEFNRFLRDDFGRLRHELFESNVRDFQGSTEVNEEIGKTLSNDPDVEFWWLNNGVTILSSKASLNGDIISVMNPQIVNGLQTSTQIARYFGKGVEKDKRKVMVKIVSSENEETRDKIIKATNSQNAVKPASLRATDRVQRDIEEALKFSGLYYDRRKNFYKNEGKPADRIISISTMAQAVMSMILGRPDTARARPSSLIKDDKIYADLFSEKFPIEMYTNAGLILRSVDRALKKRGDIKPRDRTNLRFYLLFWLACILAKKPHPKPSDVAAIDLKDVPEEIFDSAVQDVWSIYVQKGPTDQMAKGPELRKVVVDVIAAKLAPNTSAG